MRQLLITLAWLVALIKYTLADEAPCGDPQAVCGEDRFSDDCLQRLIDTNQFETVKCMIDHVYTEDEINNLLPLLRRFITKIREEQDKVLDLANSKAKMLTLAPAFQWAQDLNSVALSVKFAHRLDSPSCIDIYDQNVTIAETNFTVQCMCRRYDGVHKYYMHHELFESINVTASSYEFQSAGRLYMNLTKEAQPKRWRRLLKNEDDKPSNMRIWWEVHEKFSDELESHTTFETDDAFENLVNIESPRPKKSKGKKKKKRSSKSKPNDDL